MVAVKRVPLLLINYQLNKETAPNESGLPSLLFVHFSKKKEKEKEKKKIFWPRAFCEILHIRVSIFYKCYRLDSVTFQIAYFRR